MTKVLEYLNAVAAGACIGIALACVIIITYGVLFRKWRGR